MGKRERTKTRKKKEWSKCITTLVIACGFVIVQECFVMMYLCIKSGYTSTAAWLTAAVGLAEAVIGTGLAGYLGLCKVDHTVGGLTHTQLVANLQHSDEEENINSPQI